MKIFLAFAVIFFSATLNGWAAVEPQLEGNWQSSDGTVLTIRTDGSYQKSSQGRVVETGTLTAIDGKWSLRTDAGRPDSGSFSLVKGELTLRSSVTTTTTWKRGSGSFTPPAPAVPPAVTTSSPTLQSGVQLNAQSAPAPLRSDPFAVNPQKVESVYSTAVRAGKVADSSRGFRHGFKNGIRGLANAAQQAALDAGNSSSYGAPSGGFSAPPSAAGGRGTYSQMRKAFEQQQLSSLPPPKPIAIDRQADETDLYGVKMFENRALGPAKAVRIKVF